MHISVFRLLSAAAVLASVSAAHAAPIVTQSVFAAAYPGASAPDSITIGAGSVWVSYAGGTTSDGTPPPGVSTVVRYAPDGTVQQTFQFAGSVDGLNYNKYNNTVWALQNQDGNSSLQVINAATNAVTPRAYAQISSGNGYDEAAFTGQGTFLSYTNPGAPGDPIVRRVVNGTNPIQVTDVVTLGQTGLSAFDADSLKVAANGDLIQSGGDQGTLLFIHAPGTAGQTVTTVALTQGGAPVSGLDDTARILGTSGTLYATETSGNQVLAFDLDGTTPGSLLASIGSLQELAWVDPSTGALTPLVTGLPGIHGLAYVPDAVPEPATIALFGLGLTGAVAMRRRRR